MSTSYITSYDEGRRLFIGLHSYLLYSALLLVAIGLPFLASKYVVGEATYVFILSIASLGLMVLNGYTGQISLGHAAFLGIGAYTEAWCYSRGIPLLPAMALSASLAGLAGLILGSSSIRVSGLYLAMVTLAFSTLVVRIAGAWTPVTGGYAGTQVADPVFAGVNVGGTVEFYFFCLIMLVLVLIGLVNLTRAHLGRAFIAVRESEAGAYSLGINVPATKIIAFVLSAALTGFAGALLAHQTKYLTPEMFDLMASLQLVLMVVIGGLGSLRGALLGAVLIGLLPTAISAMKTQLPTKIAAQFGLDIFIYGLVLVVFVLFEPKGLSGRWDNLMIFFKTFPYCRKNVFRRGKSYMRSERNK